MSTTRTEILRFESAHLLPRVPPQHKCRRLHGHSYRVSVVHRDTAPEQQIASTLAPVVEQLDHHHLNEVEGLANPTAENLAIWLWQRLEGTITLVEICVEETCESACRYRGELADE